MQVRVMEVLGHSNGGHVVPSESRHGNGDPSIAMGYREGYYYFPYSVPAHLISKLMIKSITRIYLFPSTYQQQQVQH